MRWNVLGTSLAVSAWWTLYGLVSAGQLIGMEGSGGEPLTLARALPLALASAWLWIPITPALLLCVQRFPVERERALPRLLLFALFTAAVVVLRALAVASLNPLVGWYRVLPAWPALLLTSVLNNTLLLWLMIGAAHAWTYARRAAERDRTAQQLEARLAEARLEALSAQLDPHFLFNALNSIAEMVHRDAAAADRMLVGLGGLLRASLDHRRSQQVPLHEELTLLGHYLEIERQRLGDRLQVRFHIAEGLDDALLPPLLLQPLAENAIVHAIAPRAAPGCLVVRVAASDGRLTLEVEDDGGPASSAPRNGMGLPNLRSRLQCLYGPEGELSLHGALAGGTCARVRLPLRRAAGAEAA